MEFLIELFLELFGAAAEEALESPKIPLKVKIIVISVLCGVFCLLSLGLSIYFIATHELVIALIFFLITLLFVGLGIFGIRKQIKRHIR